MKIPNIYNLRKNSSLKSNSKELIKRFKERVDEKQKNNFRSTTSMDALIKAENYTE